MSIAVIYTRVSSKAQVKKGDGLASQESRCREFANYKDYHVEKTFKDEGVSGGLVDRPAMKDMLSWLRKHKDQSPIVLIDDISRFARSVQAHWKLRAAIASVGARLESPSIEFGDDSDSQLIENMLASVSQHHRQKNGEQVANRMKARLMNGYFAFCAPTGYKYVRRKGHAGKILEWDEPNASLLKEALEGFATGRFHTQSDVRRFLEPHSIFTRDKNGRIHPQRIKNLLTNKIYAGYYDHKPWDVPLTKGKHEPLISWETFQQIQKRLNETGYAPRKANTEEDFPLKGYVTCGSCGHPLTAYWAKGRNKRYPYYECFNKECDDRRKSINRDKLETAFGDLIKQMTPDVSVMTTVADMFRDIWDRRNQSFDTQRQEQKQALTLIDRKINGLTEKLIETESKTAINAYERKLEKLETERVLIKENLSKPKEKRLDFDQSFRTAMLFFANPWNLWASDNPLYRKTLLKLVFAAPLSYCRNSGLSNVHYL